MSTLKNVPRRSLSEKWHQLEGLKETFISSKIPSPVRRLSFSSIVRSRRAICSLVSLSILLVMGGALIQHPTAPRALLSKVTAPPAGQRFAFATFINIAEDNDAPDDNDPYYVSARMIGYQLMHAPATRSAKYPFVVFVTQDVKQSKRDRLTRDGAQVIQLDALHPTWFDGDRISRWHDQFTKLRFFQQTQFDRIAYFDSDTLIHKNMDAIFDDWAVRYVQHNLHDLDPSRAKEDEGPGPADYVFAAMTDQGNREHDFPPKHGDYANAGCIVFMPSLEMFDYYMKVFAIPDRFSTYFMEQDFLNYVHRREGNMPWTQLTGLWNTNSPNERDLREGFASLHDKWWAVDCECDRLKEAFQASRWKMEGFYEAWDEGGFFKR